MKKNVEKKYKKLHNKKYRQVGETTAEIDKMLKAKEPGWRISKTGKLYFENRKNRSDRKGGKI